MKKKANSSKLMIGIIQQTPDVGGAETYMRSLVVQFIKNRHQVIVASNNLKFLGLFQSLSVPTYKIPVILDFMGNYRGLIKSIFFLPYAVFFYINLLKIFKKQKVDIMLMSGFSEKMLVSFLSIFFDIPVIWIEYGPLKTIFKRNFYLPKFLYRLLNRIPNRIIVPSENTMQSMIIDAGISVDRLAIIPCGVNIPKLKDTNIKILSEFKNKFIIGNVSRLTREKGQQYLIQTMPKIIERIPNAHLLIVGDGPDKIYYEGLVAKLNIGDHVTITGFVQNLADYYMLMDIFVFSTVWELEGFGLVVPEAMSYKIPVIGNNRKPVSEIIQDGKTGFLVDIKDKKAFLQQVITLFKNKKKRKEFGNNGYIRVKDNYDITKISKRFIDIFSISVISKG